MEILEYISELAQINNRDKIAKKLAAYLNADELIIFIRDPEIGILLPGPGFPQRLENGPSWQKFLNESTEKTYPGKVPYYNKETFTEALAIRSSDNCVAVLIGGTPNISDAMIFQKVLPLISGLLIKEHQEMFTQSLAVTASKAAEKAERLVKTLDITRKNLLDAIDKNTELVKSLQLSETAYKTINEELASSNSKLTKINSDLDNFIYTASHDLKAPVSNIEGLICTLKDTIEEEHKGTGFITIIDMINLSIDRFKNTISDLTDISKIQRNLDEDIIQINIEDIIADVMITLRETIKQSEAIINISIDAACKSIKFSKINFQSIIQNLLSNAIKYQSPDRKPEILIKAEYTPEQIVIYFKDNGLGISESNTKKMFTMFKRFHDHVEGSGVGLYLVKRIIDNAGGNIEVDSEIGKGTTFKIVLRNL